MSEPVVLVTGGTGFVGSAVVQRLRRRRCRVRVLTRQRSNLPAGVERAAGDLADPLAVRAAVDGAEVVIHLAAHIGPSEQRCAQVNDRGTGHLVDAVRRAGAHRLVQLSTTSVYGSGCHRGVGEDVVPARPESATSRTRRAAELRVLDAGGTVLRPHLVYGAGDRWFVPAALALVGRVGGWIAGRSPMASVVAVDELARLICATGLDDGPPPGVYHAHHPEPVALRDFVGRVAGHIGQVLPSREFPATEHRQLARELLPWLTDHQYDLFASDHWYDSTRVWQATQLTPPPHPAGDLGRAVRWYRGYLPQASRDA